MAAQARAVDVTATGTVLSGPGTLRGLTLFSTAGATVVVYDGTAAAGTVLAKFVLAAGGDRHLEFGDGVRVDLGVHLTTTQPIEGNVRIG